MSSRPVIGIATQTLEPIAGQLPLSWVMGQKYVRVLTSLGAVPWVIPLLSDDEQTLRCIYDHLDGIFLTGGVDVDPSSYRESRHPKCGPTDPARDATETQLIRWAVADHRPTLGVCRGIQILNVAIGGTLCQDIATQRPNAIKHDYFPSAGNYSRDLLVHRVSVERDSRLRQILQSHDLQVNSMHHQAIEQLASGLVATAFAEDGLIEGIEGTNGRFLIGVQWHPEELAEQSQPMRNLFAAFIDAAQASRLPPA